MRYKVSWILPTAVSHVGGGGEPLLSCSPNKLIQIVWLQDWCRQVCSYFMLGSSLTLISG